MSLRNLAYDLAHEAITRIAGDIPIAVVYYSRADNPPRGADALDYPFAAEATASIVAVARDPANPLPRGASGDDRQLDDAFDLQRFVDAKQFDLKGIVPKIGDEWQEGTVRYTVEYVQSNDPAQATIDFGLTRL